MYPMRLDPGFNRIFQADGLRREEERPQEGEEGALGPGDPYGWLQEEEADPT